MHPRGEFNVGELGIALQLLEDPYISGVQRNQDRRHIVLSIIFNTAFYAEQAPFIQRIQHRMPGRATYSPSIPGDYA